jgi:hypothetical protein
MSHEFKDIDGYVDLYSDESCLDGWFKAADLYRVAAAMDKLANRPTPEDDLRAENARCVLRLGAAKWAIEQDLEDFKKQTAVLTAECDKLREWVSTAIETLMDCGIEGDIIKWGYDVKGKHPAVQYDHLGAGWWQRNELWAENARLNRENEWWEKLCNDATQKLDIIRAALAGKEEK